MTLRKELKIIFTGDAKGAVKAAGETESALTGAGSKIGPALAKIAAAGAGVAIVAGAVAIKSASTYATVGKEVIKMERYTGLGAAQASRLRVAFQLTGIDADKAGRAMVLFSKKLASKDVDKLGVSFRDAHGHLLPLNVDLTRAAQVISKTPAGWQRNALAVKLFGKSGADLLPFLTKGARGISEIEKQSDKFGTTLNDKDIAAVKASTEQHRLFTLGLQGMQIQIGRYVLPALTSMIGLFTDHLPGAISWLHDHVGKLATSIHDFGSDLWSHVQPGVSALVDAFGRLGHVASDIWSYLKPVVTGFAALGGAVVVGSINALGKGLDWLAKGLERNKGLVRGFVAVWAGLQVAGAVSLLAAAFETLYLKALYAKDAILGMSAVNVGSSLIAGVEMVGAGFLTMGTDAVSGASMVKGGLLEIGSALGGMTTVVVAATALFAGGLMEMQKQAQSARAELEKLKPAGFDAHSVDSLERYQRALDETWGSSSDAAKGLRGVSGANRALADSLPFVTTGFWKKTEAAKEAAKADKENRAELIALKTTYQQVWSDLSGQKIPWGKMLGMHDPAFGEIEGWVKRLNLDPMTMSVGEMTDKIKGWLHTTAREAGYAGPAIHAAMDLPPDQLKAQADRWKQLSDSISKTWHGQLDIVSTLGTQTGLTARSLGQWYSLQTTQASTFATNISKALADGYNPNLISRLLQAGPAQAAPLLQSLVSHHSSTLTQIVNDGEHALQMLSETAIALARLQTMAINSQSDSMVANLSVAMQIAQAKLTLGTGATTAAVAGQLHVGETEVALIAAQFGIDLAHAVDPVLKGVGKPPIALTGTAAETQPWHRNSGGIIPGGGPDRDSILTHLTPGEYVHNRGAVNFWGTGTMDAINQKKLPPGWYVPGFNSGGQIPTPRHIGAWPLAQAGEGAMNLEYLAAKAFMDANGATGDVAGAMAFARAQVGKPYVWGAVGPDAYDCSGLWSAIVNVLHGRNPYSRLFTSASLPGSASALGLVPGGGGLVSIGDKPGSHVAGTINGVNFEATPPFVRMGAAARGTSSPFFTRQFHLTGGTFSGASATGGDFGAVTPAQAALGVAGGFSGFSRGGRPPLHKPSWVGEDGPELWWPDTAGTIHPVGRGSSGGNVIIEKLIVQGTVITDRELGEAVADGVEIAFAKRTRRGARLAFAN